MIPRHCYVENLMLAARVAHIPGCVVECGVWRGGMIAGVASILGPSRRYYLCDSFEGLPPVKPIDGAAAARWQQDTTSPHYHDNCTAGEEYAIQAMALAGIGSPTLVKGWFDQSLPSLRLEQPIALLRLDGDWYDSTMACLQSLYDQVSPGGLIIIDDYYTWDGCSRAVHDFLSRRSSEDRIHNYGTVCYIEKQSAAAHPECP